MKNNANLDTMHVVGFSLGAEVAGFIGKTLKEWGFVLPRITGESLKMESDLRVSSI